jgi:CRISPR-associated endonuclease Csn1
MARFTLGLDLGANSIGWALVDEQNQAIIAAGVRVFPEGVDNFDTKKEKSKSEDRRVVRGMRRQIARRARRKRRLRESLVASGLYPSDAAEQARLDALDPYALRRKALDEVLPLYEFGRVLIHLNQRRGFLSNRKSDRARKKETQGMLAEINELAAAIELSRSRTLGEHLAKSIADNPHNRVRGHHTRRSMLEDEFEVLWEAQRKHYPELLTDELKYGAIGKQSPVREPHAPRGGKSLLQAFGIYGLIFFQRPMYWPKSVVGACELEPRRKRCPRADRLAQRFRLLQEVNNLKYMDPAIGDEQALTKEQRTLLLDLLSKTDEMTFKRIKQKLGFLDSIAFNLERGKRTKLQGMVSDSILAEKKLFGPSWHKRPDGEKTQIVRTLIHGEEDEIRRAAKSEWGLEDDATERLLEVDLPDGYGRLSITALEKLMPHMERGLLYMTADSTPSALSEAGYLRPDQIRGKVHDELPEPPEITNPVVRAALHELRKVVNSIIRRYGKPAEIHLELARNAAASSEERRKMSERMREREAERDQAAEKIREHGAKVTREAIDRYLLWQEQGEVCIYSGEPISLTQLLGGEAHIDHVLPYSRCLDDSFANKVVCCTKSNKDKGNQTPYEWLATRDPERFEKISQRAFKLPYNKRRKFTQKELELDKFIERQLNDTRYISRAALEYLRTLYSEPHDVLCPKGSHTETLRWLWGLNKIIREDSLNRKNRTDHRHHAIDAIVIALTDRRRLQALSNAAKSEKFGELPDRMSEPWEGFRAAVEESVIRINVSHRVRRKVVGELHESTNYGKSTSPGLFVYRKPLHELSKAMVGEIRDPAIRNIVLERLRNQNVDLHGDGSIPAQTWLQPLKMPSGIPIKKVRLLKSDGTIRRIRGTDQSYVKPGSNHHVEIIAKRDGQTVTYLGRVVNMLDAVKRLNAGNPIVDRQPDVEGSEFHMSLAIREAVLLNLHGQDHLCVVQKISGPPEYSQGGLDIHLRLHTDARRKGESKAFYRVRSVTNVNFRKVTVTPLGEIRWAND